MKTFLTSAKGKVVAGVVTVAVIGAVIAGLLFSNRGYRTIAVEELNGTTTIINNNVSTVAYVGQHLKSGDDASVEGASDLTLALDTDKYVYAKEMTHFWIEAEGKENDSRTSIHLAEGSTLCRIDNKLGDAEKFDVETSNATMSVRGTVFGTECYTEAGGDTYTIVDVYEGEVFVQVKLENGQNTEQSRLLKAGERAIIRSNNDFSEFVEPDNGDEGIEYHDLTQAQARFLGSAIDSGRVLSISKELLYDIVEITEHNYSEKGEIVEATCTEDGYYYDICSVCGRQGEKHIIKKIPHTFVKNEAGEDTEVCLVCGTADESLGAADEAKLAEAASITPEAAKAPEKDNKADDRTKQTADAKPTATPVPQKVDPCAKGHTFEIKSSPATCTEDGVEYHICKYCGYTVADYIPALGHSYTSSSADATCTSDGYHSEYCTRCGDGFSETTPALEHDWVKGPASDYCSRCGSIR